jgi:predicted transcriptional regulator
MSVKAFAEFAEIPYTTLHSMLERGVGKASVDNVLKVCKALEITVEELESTAFDSDSDQIETLAAHRVGDEELTEEEMGMLRAVLDAYRKSKENK